MLITRKDCSAFFVLVRVHQDQIGIGLSWGMSCRANANGGQLLSTVLGFVQLSFLFVFEIFLALSKGSQARAS